MRGLTVPLVGLMACSVVAAPAAVTELREDFTEPNAGDWGTFFVPVARAVDGTTVRTPLADAANDSVGTWGGHCPVGGSTQGGLFLSSAALPGTLINQGSFFGVENPGALGDGFVVFGAYPTVPDTSVIDESGGYLYTAFPTTPIDLSTNGRVQFDTFNGTTSESASIEMRVMLRVDSGGSPQWIVSETFALADTPKVTAASPPADGSAFTDMATVNLDPATLSWLAVDAPADAALVPLASGATAPLTLGAAVPSPPLGAVTGFGLVLETDIVRNDVYGVGVDAIRLLASVSPVADWSVYR